MLRLSVIAAIFALSACQTTTSPATSAQPTAVDALIGKTLVAGESTFIFNADGTVGGKLATGPIVGTYTATATQVCSTYSSPSNLVGLGELCSAPVIAGDTVIFNRTNGSQSPLYTIEG